MTPIATAVVEAPAVAASLEATAESRALHLMEHSRQHVLLTGKAGTGKSTLLGKFRSSTRKKVAVLAPTGIAALNVRGDTIHSFFKFKPDVAVERIKRVTAKRRAQYAVLDAVVIDEASMVRADLFDCVERFLRLNGKDANLPFGGVQMILVGDLYQLPPVVVPQERDFIRSKYASEFFFDSEAFKQVQFERIELENVYRQTDAAFIGILNAIRHNALSDDQLQLLNRQCSIVKTGGMDVTLTTVNRVADEINQRNLEVLPGHALRFSARINGPITREQHPAPEALFLKFGAQVMLLNNDPKGRWVNGSMGKVTNFWFHDEGKNQVEVLLEDGQSVDVAPFRWDVSKQVMDAKSGKVTAKSLGSCTQFPMRLAWALTIHKSQGKTFDRVRLDLSQGTFAPGQLYVALSRCRSLEGISLTKPVEKRHCLVDQRVVKFMSAESASAPKLMAAKMGFVAASECE